jgi:phthalate 4,5-dioxygenase
MPSKEDNELLSRVGPGTPMGDLMRQYWLPALLPADLPEPDCDPVRVRLLGENLVAFRDSDGRPGLLDAECPHRCASLFFGRNEESGLGCVYHGWKFDVAGRCATRHHAAGRRSAGGIPGPLRRRRASPRRRLARSDRGVAAAERR